MNVNESKKQDLEERQARHSFGLDLDPSLRIIRL